MPYEGTSVPDGFLNYEELLADAADDFRYPQIDENDGAAMCFTSGTTGFSKGRHLFAPRPGAAFLRLRPRRSFGISFTDTILPVTPMFHANAWGLPFSAAMLGAAPGSSRPHR